MKSDVRNRLVLPIVIPIGILLLIALVLFGFSRILLSVTPDAATGIALVVAATILIAAGTDQKAPAVFTGALVPGPGTKVYAIKPLQPGSYFYFCEVHPTTMTGHLTVAPEPAGAPGGGGGGGLTVTAQNTQFSTSTI